MSLFVKCCAVEHGRLLYNLIIWALLFLAPAREASAQQPVLRIVAGNRTIHFAGDGGPAVRARLYQPHDIAVDAGGNVYIADTQNHRIRRVDVSGMITTVAGTGDPGFSGDGKAASSAGLHAPRGLAVDDTGNVYIADTQNHRIRRVDVSGMITTVAGNGRAGFVGDGGSALSASLYAPRGLAVDGAGNVYIADTQNHRIRRVDVSGMITTVAGNGRVGFVGDGGSALSASLYAPHDVAVDTEGSIYIADTNNSRIRKVDAAGIMRTFCGGASYDAGDGRAATMAILGQPEGISLDAAGVLYIADTRRHRIRKISTDGRITTVAGTRQGFAGDRHAATAARMQGPAGVAVNKYGIIYVADRDNDRIRNISRDGRIDTFAGSAIAEFTGDGGQATAAALHTPHDVLITDGGVLYIADTFNHRIRMVTPDGEISTVAGNGTAGFSGDGALAIVAALHSPRSIARTGAGFLYIADTFNHRIRMVTPDGKMTTIAGGGKKGVGDEGTATEAELNTPSGIAVDTSGNLYIADTFNHRIRMVAPDGKMTTIAGNETAGFSGDGGLAHMASLFNPYDVALDVSGNIYIADASNSRIRKISGDGRISTIAGSGVRGYAGDRRPALEARLNDPRHIAVTNDGACYITDYANHRIRRIDSSGVIRTIAGDGFTGAGGIGRFTGDGTPAVRTSLSLPGGIAPDAFGRLYIADSGNHCIRVFEIP